MNSQLLQLDGVGVTYPNGQVAVSKVNVQLCAGSICGLIGMNGAGSSGIRLYIRSIWLPLSKFPGFAVFPLPRFGWRAVSTNPAGLRFFEDTPNKSKYPDILIRV